MKAVNTEQKVREIECQGSSVDEHPEVDSVCVLLTLFPRTM